MKPLFWHPLARLDVDHAADWYASQGGVRLELAFTNALQDALQQLMRHPGIGSARCGEKLGIAFLRQWPVKDFPHLVFYMERTRRVDIWRVLHARADIPSWMGEPDNGPTSPPE